MFHHDLGAHQLRVTSSYILLHGGNCFYRNLDWFFPKNVCLQCLSIMCAFVYPHILQIHCTLFCMFSLLQLSLIRKRMCLGIFQKCAFVQLLSWHLSNVYFILKDFDVRRTLLWSVYLCNFSKMCVCSAAPDYYDLHVHIVLFFRAQNILKFRGVNHGLAFADAAASMLPILIIKATKKRI